MMSNSASWGITNTWTGADEPADADRQHESARARADRNRSPPIRLLFVYNSNPAVDDAATNGGAARARARRSVHRRLRAGDDGYRTLCGRAAAEHDVPRRLRPGESGTGRGHSVSGGRSWSRSASRGRTPTCSVSCSSWPRLREESDPRGELEEMLHVLDCLPEPTGDQVRENGRRQPPFDGRPIQFVDVFPRTWIRRSTCTPRRSRPTRRRVSTSISRIRRPRIPLALISPASDKTISSTLAEIPRPEVRLLMHPDDAAARGIADGDEVRIFNELGEVRCNSRARCLDPPWSCLAAKGHLAQAHAQRLHGHVARAGHAHRHRRRRMLQRRARTSRQSLGGPEGSPPYLYRPTLIVEEENQIEPTTLDTSEGVPLLRPGDV